MNVISLFDGISCGQVALQRIGVRVSKYYASEIEKSCIENTHRNFPNTIQLGDVTRVRQIAEDGYFCDIDLLIGGSPCQGFSSAGYGLNFDDPRSRLFFEYVAVKKAVNPKFFLLENVKMKKEWENIISDQLGVSPILINSADFSGQNRQRMYWTNIPQLAHYPNSAPSLQDCLDEGWFCDREKSYCIDANYGKGSNFKQYFFKSRRQIVFNKILGTHILTEHNANFIQKIVRQHWRKLTVAECERLQTLPTGFTSGMREQDAYRAIGNGWTVDVVAHIMGYLGEY